MAKTAARPTARPPTKSKTTKPAKPPRKTRVVAMPSKARRATMVANGTKPKPSGKPAAARQTSRARETMTAIDNPMFDPEIKAFDTVPDFPSDFEELRTPKSDLAKEIAAKAVSAEDYVRSMTTQKRGQTQTFRINPYSLDIVPGFNVHSFDDEATASYIWGLSESIERQGVLRGLLVHFAGGKILVDAGEHRLRATFVAIELRNAHIEGIPIIFAPRGQSDVDRLYQQRLDNTIRRLTILEEGILVKRIIAKSALSEDEAIKEIARNYGTSVAIVQSYLETAALPEEVQTLIRHNRIGATFARQIFRETGRDPERTVTILNGAKSRVGETTAKKIMPKHIPAEELAKVRAESGTIRRSRTSSKLKYETPEPTEPTTLPNAPDATPSPPPLLVEASNPATQALRLFSLLQETEPGIMQDGRVGFGFPNQEAFEQACGLLGKLSVLPTQDPPQAESEATEPEDTGSSSDPDPEVVNADNETDDAVMA